MSTAESHEAPLGEPYEKMVASWNHACGRLGAFFEDDTVPGEVNEAMKVHFSDEVWEFSNQFLEDDEENSAKHAELFRTLLRLHYGTLTELIMEKDLDDSGFKVVTVEDFDEYLKGLAKHLEYEDENIIPPSERTDVPADITHDIYEVVVESINILVDNYKESKMDTPEEAARKERKQRVRTHAIDIGKAALGSFIGISAFALVDTLRRKL